MRLSEEGKNKILRMVVIIEIMALFLMVGEFLYVRNAKVELVDRPSNNVETKTFDVSVGENDEDITLEIPPKGLTKREEEKYIKQAKKEIDETFPGENKDMDNISENVVMKDEYADGMVTAEWAFDNYDVVNSSGEVILDKVEERQVVNAQVTLTCEDTVSLYDFSFAVVPPSINDSSGINYYLQKAFSKEDRSSKEQDEVNLPQKLEGKDIVWRRKYSFLGLKIALLGAFAAAAVKLGTRYEAYQKTKTFYRDLDMDYPKIVESLSLYVGAGLSFKNAFFRIAKEYSNSGKSRPGFDGVVYLCNNISDGMSETEAYRQWPCYCPTKDYRKLSSIIISNMKKGSKGLAEILEREEAEAFDAHKSIIRSLGEEASTKLLIPMVGLLAIVLIIVIAPAMINMQF